MMESKRRIEAGSHDACTQKMIPLPQTPLQPKESVESRKRTGIIIGFQEELAAQWFASANTKHGCQQANSKVVISDVANLEVATCGVVSRSTIVSLGLQNNCPGPAVPAL